MATTVGRARARTRPPRPAGPWNAALRWMEWIAHPALAGLAVTVLALGVVTWLPALAAAARSLDRWRRDGDPALFVGTMAEFRGMWRRLRVPGVAIGVALVVLVADIAFLLGRSELWAHALAAVLVGLGLALVQWAIALGAVTGTELPAEPDCDGPESDEQAGRQGLQGSPYGQGLQGSPYGQGLQGSPYGQGLQGSPYGQGLQGSPYGQGLQGSPYGQGLQGSPYGQGLQGSPYGQGLQGSPYGQALRLAFGRPRSVVIILAALAGAVLLLPTGIGPFLYGASVPLLVARKLLVGRSRWEGEGLSARRGN